MSVQGKKNFGETEVEKITSDHWLCQGEIGTTDFSPFLRILPQIDLVYAALPKPENFPFWYKLANKPRINHAKFFAGLTEIWRKLNAKEYHIEVGPSNKNQVMDFFNSWKSWKVQKEQGIRYSAPLNGNTAGMAKCRNATEILWYSDIEGEMPKGEYSHEYVENMLKDRSSLNCFDPVLGKGLLMRMAVKYGHACYGIDLNENRLSCTREYVLGHEKIKTEYLLRSSKLKGSNSF